MMKRKMISAVLAAVMTVGMITGCGSSQTTTENKADKADKLESQTDLSSTDYDFEIPGYYVRSTYRHSWQ